VVIEELRTERLVLRRARLSDVEAMHRIMSDPIVMRYWSTPPHESTTQTAEWVRSMIHPPHEGSDDFIVTMAGETIGKMGAWKLPEFGYLLDRQSWGHGYAQEAMGAFIAYRREMGSTELLADTDPRNTASRRLLARLGFEETGHAARTWCIGGEWCDSIYYRLAL
jgi:[ribosomal protein S5]-alanine N-acetyltransferase